MADKIGPTEGFNDPNSFASDQREARKLELGMIGRIFGGGEEKAGNFASLAFVLSVLCLMVLFFAMPGTDPSKPQALALMGSVVTGALGFALGQKSKPG